MANPISAVSAWMLKKAMVMVKFDDRLQSLEEKIEALAAGLSSRMDSVESRIEAMESRLESRMEAMESRLRAEFKADLEGVKTQVNERLGDLRQHLNDRLDVVTSQIEHLGTRFDTAVTLHERMAAVEAAVGLRRHP
jgi:DNA anti-recombination protein RmuC